MASSLDDLIQQEETLAVEVAQLEVEYRRAAARLAAIRAEIGRLERKRVRGCDAEFGGNNKVTVKKERQVASSSSSSSASDEESESNAQTQVEDAVVPTPGASQSEPKQSVEFTEVQHQQLLEELGALEPDHVPSAGSTPNTGLAATGVDEPQPGEAAAAKGEAAQACEGPAKDHAARPGEPALNSHPRDVRSARVTCRSCRYWLEKRQGGPKHDYGAGCFAVPGRRLPNRYRPNLT